MADLGPFDSVTGTLKELHWLPIQQRITYKLCIMMHAVVCEAAPVYIRDMVVSVADLPGRERLRSASSGTFDVPRVRTHYGSQAFSVAGPRAWNALPADLRIGIYPQEMCSRRILKHSCSTKPTGHKSQLEIYYKLNKIVSFHWKTYCV